MFPIRNATRHCPANRKVRSSDPIETDAPAFSASLTRPRVECYNFIFCKAALSALYPHSGSGSGEHANLNFLGDTFECQTWFTKLENCSSGLCLSPW